MFLLLPVFITQYYYILGIICYLTYGYIFHISFVRHNLKDSRRFVLVIVDLSALFQAQITGTFIARFLTELELPSSSD